MKWFRFLQRIRWRFIIVYVLLILIAMQVIGAYFTQELEAHYVNDFTSMLDQQAGLLVYSIQTEWEDSLEDEDENENETETPEPLSDVHLLIDQMLSSIPNAEVQVVDTNGIVIHTGTEHQDVIGQRNTQIEVQRALQGTRDENIRLNQQNGHRTQILTFPIHVDDEVAGALYMAASMEEMYETIQDINLILATGTVIALLFTALIAIMLARTITSPIKEMTEQTTAMAEGDFSRRVEVHGQDEIGTLAAGINELSKRLNRALSDIEEEKTKLASILFYMSDGVIASDKKGRIILMNQKAETMLGLQESEALGNKLSDVLDFPAEMKEETLYTEDGTFLLELEGNDRQSLILQINITPLHGTDEVQGVIAVLQDVTRQEQLERDRKEFVANVSHELRTPLTTMKSYLETLADGALSDEQIAYKFVHVIQNETERMIRLVHDLLQLSRIDTQQLPIEKQHVHLSTLLSEITERFSPPFEQSDLQVVCNVEEDLPPLSVDRDQLIQVMDNILSNAMKYSAAGSKIWVETYREGDEVFIEVTDEGIGIPRSELQHIFKRFYRVEKARSRDMGGTGLGLSITKEMILANGGSIEIDSDIGKGTQVRIRFPVDDREEEDAP